MVCSLNILALLAGFSFGAFIAANTTTKVQGVSQLLTVAPAIYRGNFEHLAPIHCPWLVIQGEEDEVVDPQSVFDWYEVLQADKTLIRMPDTSHFFHRKVVDLKQYIRVLK